MEMPTMPGPPTTNAVDLEQLPATAASGQQGADKTASQSAAKHPVALCL